jgi:hypothetical protein
VFLLDGTVRTIAGTPRLKGTRYTFLLLFILLSFRDGFVDQALFTEPFGIAVDSDSKVIYITECYKGTSYSINQVRKLMWIDWSKPNHKLFPLSTRNSIQALMVLHARKGNPIYKLPHDVLYLVCGWISTTSSPLTK